MKRGWGVDGELGMAEKVEADLGAELLVALAAGDLAEAAADEGRAVMGARPVAHAVAIDIVDQLDGEVGIAGERADLGIDVRPVPEAAGPDLGGAAGGEAGVLPHFRSGAGLVAALRPRLWGFESAWEPGFWTDRVSRGGRVRQYVARLWD